MCSSIGDGADAMDNSDEHVLAGQPCDAAFITGSSDENTMLDTGNSDKRLRGGARRCRQ